MQVIKFSAALYHVASERQDGGEHINPHLTFSLIRLLCVCVCVCVWVCVCVCVCV